VKSTRHLLGAIRTSLMEYYTWLLFIGIYVILGIFVPTLFTARTFQNVLVQGTTVCLLSFGMTFSMLVGKIDLSIVAVAAGAPMVGDGERDCPDCHPGRGEDRPSKVMDVAGESIYRPISITCSVLYHSYYRYPNIRQTYGDW